MIRHWAGLCILFLGPGMAASSLVQAQSVDLTGSQITGSLFSPVGSTSNYFDPVYGFVPDGFGNSASTSVTVGSITEFAFLQGGGSITTPGVDSITVDVSSDTITLTEVIADVWLSGVAGFSIELVSNAFVGLPVAELTDSFANGGVTAAIDGNKLTLTVAAFCGGCGGWAANQQATFRIGQRPFDLTLSKATAAGCTSVSGKVTLPSPAPAGGTVITLQDDLASASAPVSVMIAAGTLSKSFTIKTTAVSATESGTVTASLNGSDLSAPLTVRPMGLLSVALSASTVTGSQPVTGTAKLECKAGPGPIAVDLASSNPSVASPVAASIVVPQGLQSATFDVTTNPVLSKSFVTISGAASGITKSRKLTVNVAAAVSPTSLKFGSVPIGQTSAPLSATLTNRGSAAFSINSISVTGTAASWFAQSHNCPASLPAGASCTIEVTFKPQAAANKSAKLSIATNATSTPLSVALSGSGI